MQKYPGKISKYFNTIITNNMHVIVQNLDSFQSKSSSKRASRLCLNDRKSNSLSVGGHVIALGCAVRWHLADP